MLSDKLISQSSILNKLDFQDFVKVHFFLHQDNQLLHQPYFKSRKSNENQLQIIILSTEFIEISQQNGQKLTQTTLSLIHSLTTFNVNINLLQQKIKLLRFDKPRAEYLKQKMNDNLYQLRKIIYDKDLSDITTIQKIDWRFQIEVASKTCKSSFNPNILMHLKLKNNFEANENVVFNMDFANLKNLQYQLNQALKSHRNPKYKVARNSSV